MSELSGKTWRAIARLINLAGIYTPRAMEPGDTETCIRLIQQIKESRELASLPVLAELLFNGNTPVRVAAESAVASLFKHGRPKDYPLVDSRLRAWSASTSLWHKRLSARNLAQLAKDTHIPAEFLLLATMHRDGYVRQGAIRLLAKSISDGSEIPLLLLRTNDWVPEVREEAVRLVRERFRIDHACHFVRNYWLVKWLAASERPSCSPFASEIDDFLCEKCLTDLLFAEMNSGVSFVRRSSFALLVQAGNVSIEQIIDRAVQSFDEQIRLKATVLAIAQLRGDPLKHVLFGRLGDPFGPIRRRVLEAIDRQFHSASRPILIEGLLDRHGVVRATARALIKSEEPGFDFCGFYRDALTSARGEKLTACILGLGETGEREDSTSIVPFLDARFPRDRKAALSSLYNLDKEAAIPVVLGALSDAHAGVSRVAVNLLCQNGLDSHIDQLIETVRVAKSDHGIANALTSIARVHEWKSLAMLLMFCGHPQESIADHAIMLLCGWLRRPQMARGSRVDIKRVATEIDRVRHRLPSARLNDLKLIVRLGLANH
ncbi:MAG TPA: hypothetical protein PKN33_01040 [Phycisphaerae bacterium]|nr:hypothetical protein [Phycisphaerae bacterium]